MARMAQEHLLPSWQEDPVYGQVFAEAHKLWEAESEYSHAYPDEAAPKFVLLQEHEPLEMSMSIGSVLRAWKVAGGDVRQISLEEQDALLLQARRGIWPYALMMFHFYPDRRHIALGTACGPLMGHGSVYELVRSGSEVTLVRDETMGGWIS